MFKFSISVLSGLRVTFLELFSVNEKEAIKKAKTILDGDEYKISSVVEVVPQTDGLEGSWLQFLLKK